VKNRFLLLAIPLALAPSRLPAAQEWLDGRLRTEEILSLQAIAYGSDNVRADELRLDRAAIRVEGDLAEALRLRATGDLVGKDTRYGFEEAWLEYAADTRYRVTLGLIKFPMGAEYGIPREELPFQGYSFAAYLDGRTDVGLELDGEFRDGFFYYDVFGTAGEGFDPLGQDRNGPLFGARFVTYPWRDDAASITDRGWLARLRNGFFLGLGYSYSTDFEAELDVANPFRNKLFDTERLEADSNSYYHWNLGLDAGSVRALLESARGSLEGVEKPDGSTADFDKNRITAWVGSVSWMVTGETYDSRPYRQRDGRAEPLPARPLFGPGANGGWGALEVAVRYANGDIDRDLFDEGFTTYEVSSQEFRSLTGAINWYPATYARLSLQVVRTLADQTPAAFEGEGRDTTYAAAAQFTF